MVKIGSQRWYYEMYLDRVNTPNTLMSAREGASDKKA